MSSNSLSQSSEPRIFRSMKSDSGSAPRQNKWRLKRTLKRHTEFHPIEDGDLRYIWAAYKHGSLETMGPKFSDKELSADKFKAEFETEVLNKYHAVWVLSALTKKGETPIGVIFANWVPNAAYMLVSGMCWFPWSSKRNKVEAMVNFLSKIRKDMMLMFYALPEHKRMYEVCAMHGIIRRVGTSYIAVAGKPSALIETRGIYCHS